MAEFLMRLKGFIIDAQLVEQSADQKVARKWGSLGTDDSCAGHTEHARLFDPIKKS